MKQLKYLPINKIVFIDIETVRVSKELEKMDLLQKILMVIKTIGIMILGIQK